MNFTLQDIARCALSSSCVHEHPYTEKKTYLYYSRHQCKQCAYDPPGYTLERRNNVNHQFKFITNQHYSSRPRAHVRTVYRGWTEGCIRFARDPVIGPCNDCKCFKISASYANSFGDRGYLPEHVHGGVLRACRRPMQAHLPEAGASQR